MSVSDMAKWGEYVWDSTGLYVQYSNWYTGQPDHANINGTNEHCLCYSGEWDLKWNDVMHLLEMNFICEQML
jgi:hypothetical protein